MDMSEAYVCTSNRTSTLMIANLFQLAVCQTRCSMQKSLFECHATPYVSSMQVTIRHMLTAVQAMKTDRMIGDEFIAMRAGQCMRLTLVVILTGRMEWSLNTRLYGKYSISHQQTVQVTPSTLDRKKGTGSSSSSEVMTPPPVAKSKPACRVQGMRFT